MNPSLDHSTTVILFFICICSLLFFLVYPSKLSPGVNVPLSLLCVFGSGGHTKELLSLLQSLPRSIYSTRSYIRAITDQTSIPSAVSCGELSPSTFVHSIPRAREVGQSFFTAVWTTVLSFYKTLGILSVVQPHILLVNGPGTCLPVCIAAVLLRFVGLLPGSLQVVFIESACRVDNLSLTGKILYNFRLADVVAVQWPQLAAKHPRVVYIGLQI